MSDWQLKSPVAFFIFNRPDLTEKVFNEIRRAKPPRLLIVADGPRASHPGEADLCAKTRDVVTHVNWPCQVETNYSEINLGCKQRVSTGLDWVFSNVDEAIILEDDCLPHASFFTYCAALLERYRDDERVMMISGDQFQPMLVNSKYSYCFSSYSHIWGWATWRRAWRFYDVDMALWPLVSSTPGFQSRIQPPGAWAHYKRIFENLYLKKIDTWDYQWQFACWVQGGLTILPKVNLISNIGFRDDATHTHAANKMACLPIYEMPLPLVHPPFVFPQTEIDSATYLLTQGGGGRFRNLANRVLRRAHSLLRPTSSLE